MAPRKARSHASYAPPAPFDGYVVCIGASAGGLDALERFFKACPLDTGAAFVVIQHLSPDHKSMMNNLLARHTEMDVVMVEDEMPLAANKVFLIPPGSLLHIEDEHLRLTPKSGKGLALPIDIFFASLAEKYQAKAVGIVLSGTGSDGSRGAVAISAAGGFVMAQSPQEAKFDGMPKSAIGTGAVDAVLSVDDLPKRLVSHILNLPTDDAPKVPISASHALKSEAEVLAAIILLLHQVGGIDFGEYKQATVLRRIERRMQIHHTPTMLQYLTLLEEDHLEALALRREMLISVTSFFRDPEVFDELVRSVIDPMVASLPMGDTIRVWSAGTATGEEAYTLAMLFVEAFERHKKWATLKIFATDVDQLCLDIASNGKYPESAAAELSPERLSRFFVKEGDYYVVKSDLRQNIVFARHNLMADPPFTRMDLAVCRNTLIYFKPGAQERVLRSLQYSIRDGGVLMLGNSESLGNAVAGIQVVHAKCKIFRRIAGPVLPMLDRKGASYQRPRLGGPHTPLRGKGKGSAQAVADQGIGRLLSEYAPPAIVVDENHEIVHVFGAARRFLSAREGAATLSLSRQLLEPLVPVASALLYKVAREKTRIQSDGIRVVTTQGDQRLVRLAAHPLENEGDERPLALLCFEDVGEAREEEAIVDIDAETMARVNALERELAATRESLQATIEELETSNEELQATNEELMASNEELQSSNEELQSVNEEMSTVNAEYQEKVLILNRTNADLESMAKAAGIATIFLDSSVHITRFSPDATQLFRLRESDIGRPLDEIKHHLDYPNLITDLDATLKTERMIEHEVRAADGQRTYLTRILPYHVPSSSLRGVVATFVDVTSFHDAKRLQSVIDALPEHIAVLNPEGEIVMVNAAWKRFAQANGDAGMRGTGVGANYLEACNADACDTGQYAAQGIRKVLDGTLPTFTLEYPCHSDTEERWFVMNVSRSLSTYFGAVISHVNVTHWHPRKSQS